MRNIYERDSYNNYSSLFWAQEEIVKEILVAEKRSRCQGS